MDVSNLLLGDLLSSNGIDRKFQDSFAGDFMFPKECKRTADVDSPIAEVS